MKTDTVLANGVRFTCLSEGDGPLVLLVHGFPDTAHSWDRTRPALAAAGFRAVSPFTRGYAPTEVPADGDYRVETLGHDLGALIEALGARDAIVVGHDWGAAAAFAAASLHRGRVRALATLAIPHPAAVPKTPALLWKGRHFITLRLPGAAARARKNDFATIEKLVRRWSPAWDVPPGELDAVKRSFSSPGSLEAAIGYYRAVGLKPPRALTAPVEVPSIAFAGATDPFVGPAVFEGARRRYKASYEVVTLPGGHFLHREHPDPFNQALLAWMRRL